MNSKPNRVDPVPSHVEPPVRATRPRKIARRSATAAPTATVARQLHYPAHESLQEYAARTGTPIDLAYADWHDRSYEPIVRRGPGHATMNPSYGYGPGLGLDAKGVGELALGVEAWRQRPRLNTREEHEVGDYRY